MCICMAESLHFSRETPTILSVSYIPIRNVSGIKKLKLNKKQTKNVKFSDFQYCPYFLKGVHVR